MGKLHELLAVESSLSNQMARCMSDLEKTFNSKPHHFQEKIQTFTPFEEGADTVIESQSSIQTTVADELKWISEKIIPAIDAAAQIAKTNTVAKADVMVGDKVIIKDVPATYLLELEKRLAEIHKLAMTVPTLDPTKGFTRDPNRTNQYQAREVLKTRTKKINRPVVLYEATDKHPAQVQMGSEDVPIGRIKEQEWSSMITPATKAELISRIEDLQRAVKQARARANATETDDVKYGKDLMKFIFG